MKKLRRLFSLAMCVILVISCFACSDPGADIETVGSVTVGDMTAYIEQTVFTVEEGASFTVYFKLEPAATIDTGPPLLEKYTRSGWSSEGYSFPAIHVQLMRKKGGIFTYDFSFADIGGATVEPGVYRLTFSAGTTVDGTHYGGSFPLIFRIV